MTNSDRNLRYVARQPIFDRERRLVGYELLYRSSLGSTSSAGQLDAMDMSRTTLVTGLLDIGLEQLTGPSRAWINVPRDMLLSDTIDLLDPKRVVIELLETISPDAEVIEACAGLKQRGYVLALDDFMGGPEYDPLLALSDIVKIDVLGADPESLASRIDLIKKFNVQLLAERIETKSDFLTCCTLGFELFQGYYFRRPEVIERRTLPIGMIRVAKLMALVGDSSVSDLRIEEELRTDPGLSLKLLRIVNNAASGNRDVASLRHAIQLAGRRALHQWLAMLFVTSAPVSDDVDRELIVNSLERGRFCELLALESGHGRQAEPLFLVGLLAHLDEILGVPMDTLLKQTGVSSDVAAALRGEAGPHTAYLDLVNAYSTGDWGVAVKAAESLGVGDELPVLYGEAGGWARQVFSSH